MKWLSVLSFCVILNNVLAQPCINKLDVSKAVIVYEDKGGNPAMLFDEQKMAGDPLNKKGGNAKTVWFPGWAKRDHPSSMYINLLNPARLSSIYIRDVNDMGVFKIEAGSPGKWTTLIIDSLKNYQTWNAHPIDITTQYLRFTRLNGSSNVSEIVLYGCMLPDGGSPSGINDLRVNLITDRSIKILWKSTGDDEKFGAASYYDIRYSTSPIVHDQDFEKAKPIEGEPTPKVSGTVQSYLVRNLLPQTTYYFAMKASDDVGNKSILSNIIKARTVDAIKPNVITMDKFIGANAFVDDPLDKVKAVGFIREYHNWKWDEGGAKTYEGYPLNKIKFAPSAGAEGSWNFDTYYAKVKEEGLEISPVIHGNVNWLQGSTNFPFEDKPLDKAGIKSDDPNSYQAKAHHLFQFAARYGNTYVKPEKLTLDSDQLFKSGLGLVHYVEDWNEPNKYWLGPEAEFHSNEYAAMASANYDGHGGTMIQGTKTFGVKQADPQMKFVMGGTFGIDLDWIEEIQSWFENNRSNNAFIPDVLNVHHYSWKNKKSAQGGGPPRSPEDDNFKEQMMAVVDYRDKHFPNVEVWISEFGWDTNPGSPLAPPAIGSFDVQEVQAQWLVRAYLAFAAAGVDRAQMYMLRDINPQSPRWFTSCGLVGPKDDWSPKKSWYYVYTLKNSLTNMVYIGEEKSNDPNILIYKFRDVKNTSGAYVVWSKTKVNYVVPRFELKLVGSPKSAKKVELTVGEIKGKQSQLSIQNNSVTFQGSERPVIILVDDIK
ncbi:MAG TPA: fibronectin type III domain-containing protein [Chryseolinea sp.]|nr:fibronectin type III domain-containing protein [Chryseolinea sp.]